MGLSSKQILDFIPLETWTSVFVLSINETNINGTYIISTNEKYLKRCQDMYKMALLSYTFKKVCSFQLMGLVAVEIEGLWCRGRMLSFNEFLVENTVIELIDSGSIIKKQLCNLYELPDTFKYDPLCLTIKPVNETSDLKLKRLYVQPLLLESELHKGYVVVNVKDTINVLDSKSNIEEINIKTLFPLADDTQNICNINNDNNNSECNNPDNSVIQNSNSCNNLLCHMEKPDFKNEYDVKISDELKEDSSIENMINLETLFDTVNKYELNNTFFDVSYDDSEPVFVEHNISNDTMLINKEIEYNNKVNNFETNIITETSVINDSFTKSENFNTSEQNLFQNGSLVQFSYGTNIDFVFIRSYEQKQKYSSEMKQFYNYYEKKENLKIKNNPKTGDLVAAILTHYNEIHRAIILNKNVKHGLGHSFLCFFIDIGCKEYIKSNNIFDLFEEAKKVPYLAHKVGMQNMPFNNTMQLKYLKNYFDELYLKPLIMEFDECDPNALNKVILKNKVSNVDIYSEVKDYIQKSLSNFQLTNDDEIESKIMDYLNFNDLLKSGNLVSITYYYSINQIYVRINSSELTEYYNQIITEVNQFYINSKGLFHRKEPRIGEKVAVKSSTKNQFARAIIIKKMVESYLVHFVDYGLKEIVKKMEIFVLPYKFRHLPQSVIKIGLNVALPMNKVKKLPDYFNHLIQSAVPLIVEFDEEDPLGFQKAILKKMNGINLYEDICNLPD